LTYLQVRTDEQEDPMSTTSTYTVTGMTCGHCVQAVTDEVSQIAGVEQVDVDLATGALTVVSSDPLPRTSVETAVDEAGYALAP
jgi:copper chaperone CopZ